MALTINITEVRGLSNEVCCESVTVEKQQGNAVLAFFLQ